jgi:hypothetical protein
MYVVFMDESGDHNLDANTLDNMYNVFVLGAVCFRQDHYNIFDKKFKSLKKELFGTDKFVVHTAEITRPSKSKNTLNTKFHDKDFRNTFYTRINELIEATPFSICSMAIKKNNLVEKYGFNAHDPYHLSFENVLNRILNLCNSHKFKLYPEKRGHAENARLELEFLKIKNNGTKFYHGKSITKSVEEFALKDKALNLSGNQLADLIVTPIGRHILKKNLSLRETKSVILSYKKNLKVSLFFLHKKRKSPAPQWILF